MFDYDVVFSYKMPGLPKDYTHRAKLNVTSQVVGRSDHASLERAVQNYLRDEFEERGINFDAKDYVVKLLWWREA